MHIRAGQFTRFVSQSTTVTFVAVSSRIHHSRATAYWRGQLIDTGYSLAELRRRDQRQLLSLTKRRPQI